MAMPQTQTPFIDLPDAGDQRKAANLPGSATPILRKYRQLIGGIWCDPAGGEWLWKAAEVGQRSPASPFDRRL